MPRFRSDSAASGGNYTRTRPDSGLSSGSELYSTQSEGYEVPLYRGKGNKARNELLAAQNSPKECFSKLFLDWQRKEKLKISAKAFTLFLNFLINIIKFHAH